MPKSFLIRKKSSSQTRNWEDATHVSTPAENKTISEKKEAHHQITRAPGITEVPQEIREAPHGITEESQGIIEVPKGIIVTPKGIRGSPQRITGTPQKIKDASHRFAESPHGITESPRKDSKVPSRIDLTSSKLLQSRTEREESSPDDEGEKEEPSSSPRKRYSSDDRIPNSSGKHLRPDFFQFPPSIQHYPHLNPHRCDVFTPLPDVFRRDCSDFYRYPRVPLLHPFHAPVMWNPLHAPQPPFLHVHSPPHWLPSPPMTKSPPTSTLNVAPLKTPSPVGVLSPAEIPSPSSSAVAEEPSSYNCAVVPAHPNGKVDYPTSPDQSVTLLPAPVFPVRDTAMPPFTKPTGVKVEVINNGYGIKNPLLTNERQGQVHPEVTQVGSPYLISSESGHTCSLCGFSSESLRLLQKHLKSHKEIKRFLCTVCAKGFNDTFDLKRHTRTHTGVRPYKCEKCGKAFTQRCSLESHSKKIHGFNFQFAFNERRTKTYVCEECGHSTSDPEEHFVHLRTQHPNNPAILRCHDRRQFKFSRRKTT